jgi:hypothetical protein
MKIYQAVQKLLVGDTYTHKRTGDLISLLSFLEYRLKWWCWVGPTVSLVDTVVKIKVPPLARI